MNRLFWGLFFVLLDYQVTLGSMVIEVLPDVIGYYLLMKGMEELAQMSIHFDRGRHWAFGMAIVSGLIFGAELMNPQPMTKVWLWTAELGMLAVLLVLIRKVLRGLREMGKNAQRPEAVWMILAVLLPLCHLVSWVPVVGGVSGVAAMVIGALFLLSLYPVIK